MEQLPEGFKIPIHRSLTTPIMLGGVPRSLAIINGTFAISFVVSAQSLWLLPLGIASHLILALLHKRDPQILKVLKRNLRCPSILRS